jgi:hypothetical protein
MAKKIQVVKIIHGFNKSIQSLFKMYSSSDGRRDELKCFEI